MEYLPLRDCGALPEDALAAFVFDAEPPDEDSRWIRVGLAPFRSEPVVELWRAGARVRAERHGALRCATSGRWSAGCIELDENEHGGLEAASMVAYAMLQASRGRHGTPHLLRVWNYLDGINTGDSDDERYRRFCAGRAAGLGPFPAAELPAATGIGRRDGSPRLQVYWLAGSAPGTPVENPRQLSAWRYPRQYGPVAPRFSRAMRLGGTLLVSGTASVVGHATVHHGDFDRQFDETLANLGPLIEAAGARGDPLARPLLVKAYVRHPEHAGACKAKLSARLPLADYLVLAADICRQDLLLELDCVAVL
jgi:chorismate lyase / 3-hydroxybenzoate synthase